MTQNRTDTCLFAISTLVSVFPTQWFSSADEERLEYFISEVKKRSLSDFFAQLSAARGVPKLDELQTATDTLNFRLRNELICSTLPEILSKGSPLLPAETRTLNSHLNKLLPRIKISNPINVQYELPKLVLTLLAVLGVVSGFLLGGAFARLAGVVSTDVYHLYYAIGAVAGTVSAVYGSLYLADSKTLRQWLGLSAVALAAGDITLQTLKTLFLPKWLDKSKKRYFLIRLLGYVTLYVVSKLLTRKEVYDQVRFRAYMDDVINQYLHVAMSVVAVLMLRVRLDNSGEHVAGTNNLVTEIIEIINRTGLQDEQDRDELIQEVKKYGYQLDVDGLHEVVWSVDLEKMYRTFGYIEAGNVCSIIERPIVRNGAVIKLGQVKRKKTT